MATKRGVLSINICLMLFILIEKTRSEANVAFAKTAEQSSTNGNVWVASTAVDGCIKTIITDNCCTHTSGTAKTVWWRVDFDELMTIDRITIYYRHNFQQRLAGYSLYVSNTTDSPPTGALCYQDTSSKRNEVQLLVTHQCPYVGRYVTVYNYRGNPKRHTWYDDFAILELCEVQVFGCQVGRYGNGDCSNQCSGDCYGGNCNSTTGVCFYCAPGKHGDYCDSDCPGNCKTNICEKNTGYCFECKAKKFGNTCEHDCSVNCWNSLCAKDTGYCHDCVTQKYGNTCDYDCSANCKDRLCERTGRCNECNSGTYGNMCEFNCSANCKNRVCTRDHGICNECIPGKHGAMCNQNCPTDCKNNLCTKDTGTCFECNPGIHGIRCDQTCPTDCKDMLCAQDTGFCTECKPGKYGNKCDQTCPTDCKNMLCTQDTGNCIECNDGKHGDKCDVDCPMNCKDNICVQDTGFCNDCNNGKHGDKCDAECPMNCKDNICVQDTGFCNACIPTKRGEVCDLDCPTNCLNGICDKSSASCSNCVGGFYGTNCSIYCNSRCTECHQQSGDCTNCTNGLYGRNCSQACGRCSICELDSGLCATPCDPGYEGSFCKRQAQVSEPPGTDPGPIAGGVVGALLVVVVVVIVLVIIIRRRRQDEGKHDNFTNIGSSVEYSEPLDVPVSNVDRGKSKSGEENVYSNPPEPKEDPNEHHPALTNVYTNADEVARKAATEDSVYYNSGPIGFPVSQLKSLVQTKMQNKAKAFEIEYKSIPSGALHDHNIGMMQHNKAKNRFKTTFPYDHSRVVLDLVGNDPHSDYINANYIDSVTKTAEYIATQGPRPGTINDFWRMIWQLNSGKIVMLTNLVEGSRPKCDKYWPDEGEPLSTTHFNIILDRERAYAFYVIRDLTVTEKKTKTVRQIHQFHYTTWPDHGTPDPNELVVFHRRVKQYENALKGKMVVHCSAGIGRTGTFIALDALLIYGKEFGRIDVMQYIKTMRKDRINMVQTAEQYIAIHQILAEAFDMPDTLIQRAEYHTTVKALSNNGPTNQTKLRKEYQLTQTLKPKFSETDCKAALQPANKAKNKTLNVLAADKYRAYLRSYTSDRTDYINAVAVPSYTSKTGYIVTQTPMEDTVVDMLTMVMDHNCKTIVVIDTDAIDWLPQDGGNKTIGNFTLEQKGKSSTIANVDLIEIAITNQVNEFDERVRVFHLSGWDTDSSVPQDSSLLLQVLELVDSRRKSDDTKTTVVMCRDGCFHSGLFCCISNARDQMKIDDEVDIFQTSRQLLVRRPEFLINFEQYQCCYNVISDYLDTTDVYVN